MPWRTCSGAHLSARRGLGREGTESDPEQWPPRRTPGLEGATLGLVGSRQDLDLRFGSPGAEAGGALASVSDRGTYGGVGWGGEGVLENGSRVADPITPRACDPLESDLSWKDN